MAQDEDFADPFAIPDFWKTSPWLEPTTLNPDNTLFALDVASELIPLFRTGCD